VRRHSCEDGQQARERDRGQRVEQTITLCNQRKHASNIESESESERLRTLAHKRPELQVNLLSRLSQIVEIVAPVRRIHTHAMYC
jgi:hypothetical protein